MTFASILIQLLNGLAAASSLFLVSAGLSLIFGVTRIVNFAHGSLYMLGLYGAYSLIEALGRTPFGFWSAVVLAALLVGVVGVAIEVVILRRIYRAPELFQLLATFAIVLIVKDAALHFWGPEDLVGPRAPGLAGAVEILGRRLPEYDLLLIAIGPVVLHGSRRTGIKLLADDVDVELARHRKDAVDLQRIDHEFTWRRSTVRRRRPWPWQ